MEFDDEGYFKGFIGAPRVAPSLADVFWRKVGTKEQKKRMSLFLPTEYSNFDIDKKGFIYATVSGGAIQKEEAVRRLNPAGKDVLRRTGHILPIGDVKYPTKESHKDASITGRSVFIDVAIQDYGIYNVLDQKRGRIFTYDTNGNLLYVFGGFGNLKDAIKQPVSIEILDKKLLVLDSDAKRIKIFEPTEYALAIQSAIQYYSNGKYDKSAEMWNQVLKQNTNYELAYSGIGRSLLRQNKFKEAMDTYRLGNDPRGYSEALGLYRREVVSDNFSLIMSGIISIILLVFIIKKFRLIDKFKQKINLKIKKGSLLDSLKYALYVIFHPFDGFWDLKHEKRGNLRAAIIILFTLCLTFIFAKQYTGFVFNQTDISKLNIYMEFVSVIVPFILWCGINWAVTTLMQGKGKFRDICIATAYAMTPIIIVRIPLTVVSNCITSKEGAFYFLFLTIATLWSQLLVFFGTMVTHQYSMKRTIFTSILTIIGIGIVLFIGLLFFSVISQVLGFGNSIYSELIYRL